MDAAESLRYPIGKFTPQESFTPEEIEVFIKRIETLPAKLAATVKSLSNQQLDTPYRDGGWTARQVVHHLADSHMNAYIRFKWTLTEHIPSIKAYDEKAWANTPETLLDPAISINLLTALHVKLVALIRSLSKEDMLKQFYHPDQKKFVRIDNLIGTYAWHGDHHHAHVMSLI